MFIENDMATPGKIVPRLLSCEPCSAGITWYGGWMKWHLSCRCHSTNNQRQKNMIPKIDNNDDDKPNNICLCIFVVVQSNYFIIDFRF